MGAGIKVRSIVVIALAHEADVYFVQSRLFLYLLLLIDNV
jgi:hypothetical protein